MLEKLFHPTMMVFFHAEMEWVYEYTVCLLVETYMRISEYRSFWYQEILLVPEFYIKLFKTKCFKTENQCLFSICFPKIKGHTCGYTTKQ